MTAGAPGGGAAAAEAETAPGDVAIHVDGLHKSYGRREVLAGVTFDVRKGELLALLGPNGAGKTSTVEILEGYRRADAGTVRVLGLDPAHEARALHTRMGFMLQDGGVENKISPREALRLYARFYRDPEDPDELLEAVDLGRAADTRYRRLSGGEKQRLGLALALLGRPELLVLDEPTAGMDPAAKQATRERIAALRAAGTTILLTTHELGDVERLADRVAVLDRGRLVAHGSPAELTGAASPRVRFRLSAALPAGDRSSLAATVGGPGATIVEAGAGAHYELIGLGAPPDTRLVASLAAWCAGRGLLLTELRLGAASLEERYLELVGADVAGEAEGAA